jgi:hypothetical protein
MAPVNAQLIADMYNAGMDVAQKGKDASKVIIIMGEVADAAMSGGFATLVVETVISWAENVIESALTGPLKQCAVDAFMAVVIVFEYYIRTGTLNTSLKNHCRTCGFKGHNRCELRTVLSSFFSHFCLLFCV